MIATRTGIHRDDELKFGGILHLHRHARNGNHAGFERFAQRFERATIEFRQLIEKQHPPMREADLSRRHTRTATDYRVHRCGVMRATERTTTVSALIKASGACRGHHGHFHRLSIAEWRQQSCDPMRQHAFAGPWWTDEEEAVVPGNRHGERALCLQLTTHIQKIESEGRRALRAGSG